MKCPIAAKFTVFCLGLVPTLSACAIKDIAGDAGVGGTGAALDFDAGAGGATAAVLFDAGDGSPYVAGGALASSGGAASFASGGNATGGAAATGGIASTGGSTASPITLPTWATADGCVIGTENAQFIGTWEGYIQGTPIGDEPSSLRLNIVGANSRGLCGTVTVGTHTAPVTIPPATTATDVYPPGATISPNCRRGPAPPLDPILGLAYTIQDGKSDGQRATFAISYTEVYRSWCSLQTSYPNDLLTGYACLPNTGGYVDSEGNCYIGNGSWQQESCMQFCLCAPTVNICACGPQGCTANPDTSDHLFDLLFNGNQAMGMFGSSNVVFNRVAACLASGSPCQIDGECCTQSCAANGDAGFACK